MSGTKSMRIRTRQIALYESNERNAHLDIQVQEETAWLS